MTVLPDKDYKATEKEGDQYRIPGNKIWRKKYGQQSESVGLWTISARMCMQSFVGPQLQLGKLETAV